MNFEIKSRHPGKANDEGFDKLPGDGSVLRVFSPNLLPRKLRIRPDSSTSLGDGTADLRSGVLSLLFL
jgi:hypothetical protein